MIGSRLRKFAKIVVFIYLRQRLKAGWSDVTTGFKIMYNITLPLTVYSPCVYLLVSPWIAYWLGWSWLTSLPCLIASFLWPVIPTEFGGWYLGRKGRLERIYKEYSGSKYDTKKYQVIMYIYWFGCILFLFIWMVAFRMLYFGHM